MRENLILDTCALIWLVADSDQLSAFAKEEIEAAQVVYVSPISAWEVSLKQARGDLELPLPSKEWFERSLTVHNLALAELSVDVLSLANDLPRHHKDPADRFIIATATLGKLTVVTSDKKFDAYDIKTIR
jgi:PIN domain nuclease of toxin-antitoxin system